MSNYIRYIVFVFCFIANIDIIAQRAGTYRFDNTFEEESGALPALKILGGKGNFEKESLPELNDQAHTVYLFEKNWGLQFDNKAAKGFLKDSYTIEIYFRFETLDSWKRVVDFKNRKSDNGCYIYDGKLNFYNFAVGIRAPVKANQYTHYIVSRDGITKLLKMYVDGESKVEFIDKNQQGVIDADGVLNFFFDDLIVKDEASAGAVAYIKLYDYVVPPTAIKQSYLNLEKNIIQPTLPSVAIAEKKVVPPPTTISTTPTQTPTKKWFIAQAQNSNSKQIIPTATLTILDSNMVETQKITAKDGVLKFLPELNTEYNLIIEAQGYISVGINIPATTMPEKLKYNNIFSLQPVAVGENIILKDLRFAQSSTELLPSAYLELEKLTNFLKNNPTIAIELQGHTDNQGDFERNLELSKQRVETIKAYLVKQGIDPKRIQGRGYGSTRPIANNSREETRQLNRRVEFVILKY